MSKLCPKCQYVVGAPLLSSTALILLGMEFTRTAQVDAPHVLNRVQVWRHTWPLHHLHLLQQGSVILAVCLGRLCWKTVSEGRASSSASECHTVHVGIHVSFNEPQLPSTSSSHATPDHDATTTMLDCRQGTIFLVLLTRASPHMLDTICIKQVYLRLIRPHDMVPGSTRASVFWSQLLHLMHSTRTQLLWSTFARPVPSETRLGKPLFDPGHCTVTQFQAVTGLLIA